MSDRRPAEPAHQDIVALIADIFERRGQDAYIGEPVTMSQHMLQSAFLAERAGADEELVVAALLHDIGHFTSEFPLAMAQEVDNRHEHAGAAVLASWFAPRLVDCVRHHVDAKRYLCAVDGRYHARLSAASVHSLELQGGPLDPPAVARFAAQPNVAAIVWVRRLDDAAKDPARTTPPFAHYAPLIESVRLHSGRS